VDLGRMLAAARAGGPSRREDARCRGPQLAGVRGAKLDEIATPQAGLARGIEAIAPALDAVAQGGDFEKDLEAGTLRRGETAHGRLAERDTRRPSSFPAAFKSKEPG